MDVSLLILLKLIGLESLLYLEIQAGKNAKKGNHKSKGMRNEICQERHKKRSIFSLEKM